MRLEKVRVRPVDDRVSAFVVVVSLRAFIHAVAASNSQEKKKGIDLWTAHQVLDTSMALGASA